MNESRHGSQSVKPVLVGPIGKRAGELIREICGTHDVQILKGPISQDHVHLLLSIPPEVTISRLVRRLKGKTAYQMLQEFAALRKEFRGRHLWARGQFCCGTRNVTDEAVAASIANRGESGPGDFRVEHGDF
jgi:putative transposase